MWIWHNGKIKLKSSSGEIRNDEQGFLNVLIISECEATFLVF